MPIPKNRKHMIEILSPNDSAESEAASELHDLIVSMWPTITTDVRHEIVIIPNVKCYGEKREDIDIVVFARFGDPLPAFNFQKRNIFVNSLCLAIEVKDHSPGRVQFTGNTVEVLYSGQWENASQQNFEQMGSLLDYLKRRGVKPPFVTPLIWLRNHPADKLPAEPHNILGNSSKWQDFLCKVKTVRTQGGEEIRASRPTNKGEWSQALSVFSKRIQPTRLDRLRMERLSESFLAGQLYAEKLGQQLLIFSGRGGTGKTVRLLRLAHDLYRKEGARVLILTYHKALVSDIRRLFALMNIRDGVGERSLRIQTVHSFMLQLLAGLGLLPDPCNDFLSRYELYKTQALELLAAVQPDDISKLARQRNEAFNRDYILIDEAQDWPENERDILFAIYDYRRFVLADGIAQLARKQERINWRENVGKADTQVVSLREIIRAKKNISLFVKEFASRMHLDTRDIQPYRFAEGGDVIIVEGHYSKARKLHDELLRRNSVDGNEPVDMLFCIPPNLVKKRSDSAYSLVGEQFKAWGYEIWDGVAEDIRESYPTDNRQLRLIQYDSCRGLEGWIVVNLAFNEFYDYKYGQLLAASNNGDFLLDQKELAAHEFAARWLMIPLTRAMDTLVIHVSSTDHKITDILRQICEKYRDFIEWQRLEP